MLCARCQGNVTKEIVIKDEKWCFCNVCSSFNVLDKGFVSLVSFTGGDDMVVRAARISYGKELKGEEQDKKLIKYMMKNRHGTPFEHSVFIFHVKTPIFVSRQWMRHRISSFNEISGRYTEYSDEFYIPERLRTQDVKNKQGSIEEDKSLQDETELIETIKETIKICFESYKKLLQKGVAREMARAVLPLSVYTQFYWTVNARSLMNFLNLRISDNAQWEIRQYAKRILFLFKERMPWTFEAFLEFGFTGESKFVAELID